MPQWPANLVPILAVVILGYVILGYVVGMYALTWAAMSRIDNEEDFLVAGCHCRSHG